MPLHPSVKKWLQKAIAGSGVKASRVIEFGSCMMHGHNPRPCFPHTKPDDYIGVDWRDGEGVDVVGLAHVQNLGPADCVISTQVLEHDPFWKETITTMVFHLREGGLFFVTCAGPGTNPHEVHTAPEVPGYYENRSVSDVVDAMKEACEVHGLTVEVMDTWAEAAYPPRTCVWAKLTPS